MSTLTAEMKAAVSAVVFPVGATATIVWGFSLREIVQQVMTKALELGHEHRAEIEQAARSAIDALVAFDLPGIPDSIENIIDGATRELGYQAIEKVLDAILAEQVTG